MTLDFVVIGLAITLEPVPLLLACEGRSGVFDEDAILTRQLRQFEAAVGTACRRATYYEL